MEVNENLYYLIRFIAEYKRYPKTREVYEGRKIGLYLQNIKRGYQAIDAEDAKYLARLGVPLATKNPQKNVHEKLLVLIEFMEKYKRRPSYKDVYKGIGLYNFLRNITSGNTSLNEEDKSLLKDTLKKIS